MCYRAGMKKEELEERLQLLWIRASSSCGGATSEILEEIREIERLMEREDQNALENPDKRTG